MVQHYQQRKTIYTSTVEFFVYPVPTLSRNAIGILIDGLDLREIIAQVNKDKNTPASQTDLLTAGYEGLEAKRVLPPSFHFWGIKDEIGAVQDKTTVLGCVCGEAGCCPLSMRTCFGERTVQWYKFSNPCQPGLNYDTYIGNPIFDRYEYHLALLRPRYYNRDPLKDTP